TSRSARSSSAPTTRTEQFWRSIPLPRRRFWPPEGDSAQVEPAPGRAVEEELGVSGPQLGLVGDGGRSGERIGVRQAMVSLYTGGGQDLRLVGDLATDLASQVPDRGGR